MAFDAEYFIKNGLMPMFGGTQDIIGANLQSQLARLRHQQEMEQLKEMYRMRGEEQAGGHAQTMAEMAERERLAQVEDSMQRNQILLRASSDLWAAEKTAQIHMKTTKYEEGLKHQYSTMEENLRQLGNQNPEKLDEVKSNSIKNTITSMGMLDEIDNLNSQEMQKLMSIANPDPNSKFPTAPDQISAAQKRIAALQEKMGRTSRYRDILNQNIESFAKQGVTDAGIVPKDRQAYLLHLVDVLKDKMGEKKMTIDQLQGPEVLQALQTMTQDIGVDFDINEADLKFLLAKVLKNLKATFAKPTAPGQQQ
jgi:hypothetical protein